MQQIREYKILEKLGEGGMGIVYKAFDANLDRFVAIKAIHVIHTSNTELVQRFRQEAKMQASLVHPNIVSLYNFFAEGDIYYMVMEYLEGETLSQRLKRVGLLPPHKCIPIFLQVLQAVEYAHGKGIVHRDIKPSNILIDSDDNIKVMDFGIAKIIGDKSMTKTGTKLGTLNFMSPEQVLGEKDIDSRSDIFSLGITFFTMLTGQLPYNTQTESDFKLMQQIVDNDMPSVKKYYPYVPDKVDEAISKATRKVRNERFQSCKEFYNYIKFEEIDEQREVVKKEISVPLIDNKNNSNKVEKPGINTSNLVKTGKFLIEPRHRIIFVILFTFASILFNGVYPQYFFTDQIDKLFESYKDNLLSYNIFRYLIYFMPRLFFTTLVINYFTKTKSGWFIWGNIGIIFTLLLWSFNIKIINEIPRLIIPLFILFQTFFFVKKVNNYKNILFWISLAISIGIALNMPFTLSFLKSEWSFFSINDGVVFALIGLLQSVLISSFRKKIN